MVTHWKEQNILKHRSVPTFKPAAWCSDLLDNALMLKSSAWINTVFCWCFLWVKKWPPLPLTNTSPQRRWPWDQGQTFPLSVLPLLMGNVQVLEHTVATALAVLLSLIHSQNWLQLPVCLVRACKLKQEEKGRSKCFSCAEEGWGLFFMVALLWFNLQIWSTSDLSVAHGSWQWNVVLLSGWVLDPWLGSFGPCAQWGGVSCGFGADTWEWRCWIYSTCCSAARGPEGLLWGGGDFPLQLQV